MAVTAICLRGESVRARATTVAVPFTNGQGRGHAKRFKTRMVRTGFIKASKTKKLPPGAVENAAARGQRVEGLAQGRRSSARIKVTATDKAGNKTMYATVRLR